MRKFVLSAVAFCFSLGLALATDVVFVKIEKDTKKLTVKEGDAEKTYTITDDTKIKRGEKDLKAEDAVKFFDEKAKEGKTKFSIEVDGKKLTEIKLPAGKKKN